MAKLLAVSDLHVAHPDNRAIVEALEPTSDEDWLIVAGDLAEHARHVEWALRLLSARFAQVVWTPGNHELWTPPSDPVELRGQARYEHYVALCRDLGVLTPEDPYQEFNGVTIAPLFLLYDYTFRPPGASTAEEALEIARAAGVVCTDEYLLHPDPYPSRAEWCRARVEYTEKRLAELPPGTRTVLVNHFPMTREPTLVLRHPEFAQWCGTELTADWHVRFNAAAVVYGHLHIPRTIWADGVPFFEVSLGYPREWKSRSRPPAGLREITPVLPS